MAPPYDAPPETRERRVDHALRRLITGFSAQLDKLTARLAGVEMKLEERVTNIRLLAIVGVLALAGGGVVAFLLAGSDRRNETVQRQAVEEVRLLRQELAAVRAENQALYRYFIEGRPRASVAAEAVRQKEEVKP